MKWILIILTMFAYLAGCASGRGGDSGRESEEQKLVETIRLARTLDTDSTEVEDMIIIKVYQLRYEDRRPRPANYQQIESDISNCALEESTGRLKNSGITNRIDTLIDKERFSRFVGISYDDCRRRILSGQYRKEKAKSTGGKPDPGKKKPLRETSFYELIERHYEKEALENTVTSED